MKKLLMIFMVCLFAHNVNAKPRLPYLFTDNMVLQQQSAPSIWGWAAAGKTVTVTSSWDNKKYSAKADANGRWKLAINTPAFGGPFQMLISDGESITLKNVWIGEVWLCGGQSNMEMSMKGYKDQPILGSNNAILHSGKKNIHLVTVPRAGSVTTLDTIKSTSWQNASPEIVAKFSATGWFFGSMLYDVLDVPIGLINCSYTGSSAEAWMTPASLQAFPGIKIPAATDSVKPSNANRTATALYNAMLAPVAGYGIKGCIWYQGETNYDRPDEYQQLFPAMVKLWRSLWNQGDFPFYYVQIAPFNYASLPPYHVGDKYNSAFQREAQLKALDSIPNSGMAVTMDIAEENCIHPANKQAGGERLALLALGKTYGIKGFGYESPVLDSLIIKGSSAMLKFKNAPNGLTAFGKELSCFQIAGKDKRFFNAKASFSRGNILLSAPEVPEPVAVRYAFKDFVVGDLFSTEGLPVPSFRTDNWEEGVYME